MLFYKRTRVRKHSLCWDCTPLYFGGQYGQYIWRLGGVQKNLARGCKSWTNWGGQKSSCPQDVPLILLLPTHSIWVSLAAAADLAPQRRRSTRPTKSWSPAADCPSYTKSTGRETVNCRRRSFRRWETCSPNEVIGSGKGRFLFRLERTGPLVGPRSRFTGRNFPLLRSIHSLRSIWAHIIIYYLNI